MQLCVFTIPCAIPIDQPCLYLPLPPVQSRMVLFLSRHDYAQCAGPILSSGLGTDSGSAFVQRLFAANAAPWRP
eukprot:5539034-Pyramimonas_sp.AAC.1